MITDKFVMVTGVVAGYNHDNKSDISIVDVLNKCARKVEEDTGIYISTNIIESITLYKKEWGCPDGGEKTYTITAVRNPIFNTESFEWRLACYKLATYIKKELKQSTVSIELSHCDYTYIDE